MQLAAIDMGSNSFRLELGQLDGMRYRRVDYLKETVRLGGGLDENGLLTEEARLTKQLYKLASQTTRYGEFVRSSRGESTDQEPATAASTEAPARVVV